MKQLKLSLPDEVHAALVELARREQRSLHAQIVFELKRIAEAVPQRQEGL